jgi:protease I
MKNAIIILAAGVEDTEFAYPYYRLQEEGFRVDVATKGKKDTTGKWGLPIPATVDADIVKGRDYDLVVVPGGYESPDRVRQIKNVLSLLREFDQAGKIISSVCHGPWVLISAGVVKGRRMTCYAGCKDDLINAGAIYEEAGVVTDGNIVTAPHFRNNPEWMVATISAYHGYERGNALVK